MSEVTTPIIIPAGDIQPLVPFTLPGSGGMDIQDVDTGTPGDGTGGASPVSSPGTVPANGNSENLPRLSPEEIAQLQARFGAAAVFQGQTGFDFIIGTAKNDLFITTQRNEVIGGLSGNDTVFAGEGNDVIGGGNDNDLLYGNQGQDTIRGDAGDDTAYGGQGDDWIEGGLGADLLFGDKGNDTVSGQEGNDTIYGGEGNDSLSGGKDNDLIFGNQGDDTIDGGSGDDTLYGGQGNDTMNGGTGNDILLGDRGNDILTGGEGADTFRFEYFPQEGEAVVPVANAENGNIFGLDTITDFTPVEDKIQLDSRVFEQLQLGTLSQADFARTMAFNANAEGASEAKIIYDQTSGLVYYNPSSNPGDEVPLVQIDPNLDLNPDNFEIF
ncbi:calcium-binding protein [Laspinema olomoucense]|uniref:Calcium-binding protein n=1 Tax=Laspinema olomoucense D3b TaxID=2953688 RepID=A0ABT2NAZ1_9CYAN|nr:calcium-binding protein [Laspinema sp. D3b]MCT7979863.1 calcium-binding protein [Laspinema sp. D3b]